AGGYFFGQDALEYLQEYVHKQAAQQQDARVVRVDDFVCGTRQTEAHGGFEPAGDLYARDWHVGFAYFFYEKLKK
ncbi:MAG: hypothetical protein JZU63_12375, partial [Rhodoferax sp.]|nr:hypothetical protein [Rhodoferax sp.]